MQALRLLWCRHCHYGQISINVSRETLRKENKMNYKYRARFYLTDTNGNKWVESCTPLWEKYEVAEKNASEYAEYVNTKTNRKVLNWEIVELILIKGKKPV